MVPRSHGLPEPMTTGGQLINGPSESRIRARTRSDKQPVELQLHIIFLNQPSWSGDWDTRKSTAFGWFPIISFQFQVEERDLTCLIIFWYQHSSTPLEEFFFQPRASSCPSYINPICAQAPPCL